MAEGGCDLVDPLAVQPQQPAPAGKSIDVAFSPQLTGELLKKRPEMDAIAAQLEALKLNSSIEESSRSLDVSLAEEDFKFNFKVEKDGGKAVFKKGGGSESENVFYKKSVVLDSGSDEEGNFNEVKNDKKKKKRRRTRKRSKKSEEELCVVVDVLEAETSFTVLPKSDVKELVKEMNGKKAVPCDNGREKTEGKPDGKSPRPKEKIRKQVIADVVGQTKSDVEDNSRLVKSRGKLPDVVDSTQSSTSAPGVENGATNGEQDADVSSVSSSSKKRRERRKKHKISKNVALASLLSKKQKDFEDDSDELPELVRQFLEKNKCESIKNMKANQSPSPTRPAEAKRNKEKKTPVQKTPIKEGCYSKLVKEHSIRERHDSLPAKFDRRGSSPASYSSAGSDRYRSKSQSNDSQFDLFDEARQSPTQRLFAKDYGRNSSPKHGGKSAKNHKDRDGSAESAKSGYRQGSGRRKTVDAADDRGRNTPRKESARQRGNSSASPGPQQGSSKGMTTPKKQTPRPGSGRSTPNYVDQRTPDRRGKETPKNASAKKNKTKIQFTPYLDKDDISSLLKRGELIQGSIRINPKNYEDAYVPHPDRGQDIYIKGLADRNRALNGDIVVVEPLPDDKTLLVDTEQQKHLPQAVKDALDSIGQKNAMRRGKVVYIVEEQHSRACTGHIKPMKDKNQNYMLFSPIDHRMPRIKVPASDCPKGFVERPGDFANTLFVARITGWDDQSQYAKGNVHRSLGEAGEIEPETEGMLNDYGVDYSEFTPAVIECLPQNLPWRIPESEIQKRKDLRKEIVFTIDPASARDLDDALSCVDNGDGTYEIGVHIADVSYFVHESNELDNVAASRATSVYLVQKVVPMLPRLLCEQLCSLNPDEDRLTFSVMWKMTEAGEILDIWFGRSVIRSCVKLSYEHAQGFLDEPDREWTQEELPPVSEGVSIEDIKSRVLTFDRIAKNLRGMRAENGALRLDQVKLMFVLDKETGLPCGWKVYQGKDSNKLIEEFMLLANMSVANKIRRSFPDKAMLRCHPPPQTKMIQDLMDLCEMLDIPLDATSSGALQDSLAALYEDGEDDDTQSRLQILTVLCSKPMQLAKYFCTGTISGDEDCWHYALSVPEYTHFTSPIRRYPDVIVHRQLAAALELTPEPKASKQTIQKLANHCNLKKSNAKKVSEMSNDMFFSVFVKESGPIEESGMVMSVLDRSFDVLILKFGVTKRVYINKLNLLETKYEKKNKVPRLTLKWNLEKDGEQVITLFTKVHCIIEADPQPLKWNVLIKPHDCDVASTSEVDHAIGMSNAASFSSTTLSQQPEGAVTADVDDGNVQKEIDVDEESSEGSSEENDDVVVEEVIETVLDVE